MINMDNKNITIVLIDDLINDEAAPFHRLKQLYKEIISFSNPLDGIEYVKRNISKKLIVVLDFQMPKKDGADVLKEIRKNISYLIPVIIFTEKKVSMDKFPDLIEYKANYYADKADAKDIKEKILKAAEDINNDVAEAIQEWIDFRDQDTRNKPYLIKGHDGHEYTLDQILFEIRQQSDFGKEFIKDFYSTTIKLLLLDKERLIKSKQS